MSILLDKPELAALSVLLPKESEVALAAVSVSPPAMASITQANYVGTPGNDIYNGTGLPDDIRGRAGNDLLSGGAGSDTLYGEDGNDTLSGGESDDSLYGGAGDDSLLGGLAADRLRGEGRNDTLNGETGDDVLQGELGNDLLMGDVGDDELNGGAGNDVLLGGAGDDYLTNIDGGVDTMSGGTGNDTYVVISLSDVISEAAGEGIDQVFSRVSYSLAANFENLTLAGSSNLDGTGNSLANEITGTALANRLDGGAGKDTLTGLAGNDTYIINDDDTVVERADGGVDLVISSISHGLADNVENLTLTGTDDIEGTGNSISNLLTGNDANNLLNGGEGIDTMIGGAGDDFYYVQSAGDVVIEAAGEGKDSVMSWVSYSLYGTFAENLILEGWASLSATGNSLGNTLIGNNGNNVLNGMAARDVLTGGLGADVFLFTAGSGADRITDFSGAQNDRININAYTGGMEDMAIVAQKGADVLISLGGAHSITVLNASRADVLSHMDW